MPRSTVNVGLSREGAFMEGKWDTCWFRVIEEILQYDNAVLLPSRGSIVNKHRYG